MKKILLGIAAFLVALAGGYQASGMMGSSRTQSLLYPVLDNVATSTQGVKMDVLDYETVVCSVDWDQTATATLKFVGSLAEEAPNFTALASSTNQFDYLQVVDLEDGSPIDGDTGISVAGGTDHRMVEFNTNGLNWATVLLDRTTGTTTVKCRAYNNN